MNYIVSYCHISSANCFVNGEKIVDLPTAETTTEYIKGIYKYLNLSYPKFYKMDRLSKIAFLGTELLKKILPKIGNYKSDEIGILFSNKTSSSATDMKFQNTYQNGGVPSPALFVYTLPNILIGEIAIYNKWYGENTFTISANFDVEYFTNYCNLLLNKNAEAALCGWINIENDNIEAFLFFVAKKDLKKLNLQLSSKQLLELFKTTK